jgi:protein-disulfide isomerase
MRMPSIARSHPWIGMLVMMIVAITAMTAWMLLLHGPPSATKPAPEVSVRSEASKPAGPPWLYGRADARFTVVGYADLECPYCRTYFAVLKHWIDLHPEVNWQWQHVPLSMHEPAASIQARIAECAGETGGHAAFWQAVAWLYAHTRGDGQGLPQGLHYPDLTPAMLGCLRSQRPDAVIRTQAMQAIQQGISGTPTLHLRDRESGNTLVLRGPVDGDALLSALDLLATGDTKSAVAPDFRDMHAGPADVMPR